MKYFILRLTIERHAHFAKSRYAIIIMTPQGFELISQVSYRLSL